MTQLAPTESSAHSKTGSHSHHDANRGQKQNTSAGAKLLNELFCRFLIRNFSFTVSPWALGYVYPLVNVLDGGAKVQWFVLWCGGISLPWQKSLLLPLLLLPGRAEFWKLLRQPAGWILYFH